MRTVNSQSIAPSVRDALQLIYAGHQRDAIMVDAVLDKGYGSIAYDDECMPSFAALTLNGWTLVAGKAGDSRLGGFISSLPGRVFVAGPGLRTQDLAADFPWIYKLHERYAFSPQQLDPLLLRRYASAVPEGYELVAMDKGLADRLLFAVAFESAEDLLEQGLGFCLLRDGGIASAALSYMSGSPGVDIQINTFDEAQRRKGFATCTGAALVQHCLEAGRTPSWNAANEISRALAEKLGFVLSETYSVLARTDEE